MKDGGLRPILDIGKLNSLSESSNSPCFTLASLIPSLFTYDWFAALDLQDAYFRISMRLLHRKYIVSCGWRSLPISGLFTWPIYNTLSVHKVSHSSRMPFEMLGYPGLPLHGQLAHQGVIVGEPAKRYVTNMYLVPNNRVQDKLKEFVNSTNPVHTFYWDSSGVSKR